METYAIKNKKGLGLSDFLGHLTGMAKSFEGAYAQIADPNNQNLGYDAAKFVFTASGAINEKYPDIGKKITEYLADAASQIAPTPYRPLVKGVVKRLSKEPWDVTWGYISEVALELGKDKDGKLLPTEEVLQKALAKFLQKEVIENLRRAA